MTPLTTVIARRVRPGKEADFEDWLEGIIAVSTRFDGHQGVTVLRPAPGSREYVLVVRWRDFEASRRWVESDERAAWLAKLEPLAEGEARVEEKCGLETWFTLRPEAPGGPPPPSRSKMAIMTLVAIYPLITILGYVLVPQLEDFPTALRTLVVCAILVPLMTWVVMPRMTRIFWGWLFPGVPRP
jgi:antibiotic biosynthesis monooxygenase (ABM) superfamily enzyme